MRKGMALITVIWILAILTIIVGIVVYLTTSDIAYTFIFNSRRIAMGAAETGKNTVLSQIPKYELLGAMSANDSIYYNASFHQAYKAQVKNNRFYLITPMPFPHGYQKWGTGGKWYKVFDFDASGRIATGRGNVERTVNVGAAFENPFTAGGGGFHTMY